MSLEAKHPAVPPAPTICGQEGLSAFLQKRKPDSLIQSWATITPESAS